MRILITGGLGFVGGRLAVYLAQAGHQVVLGSRHLSPPPLWLPNAEMAQIEWENRESLEQSCNGVDVVVQAAGMNAQDCAADPVAALAFNGAATARLVRAASTTGVSRFIYLSTAHVYGSPLVGTITEETCPKNLHPYATSHLAGECSVLYANQRGQIKGTVLRMSNAFGSPMHRDVNCWMLLVNDLCKQAVQTRKLKLQTSGLQHRDFIPMGAVCGVIERLVIADKTMQTGIINVGAGVSRSVLDMAKTIQQRCEQILGFKPELHRTPGNKDEERSRLTFQVDKLAAIGARTNQASNISEIDNLLHFCESNYQYAECMKHG